MKVKTVSHTISDLLFLHPKLGKDASVLESSSAKAMGKVSVAPPFTLPVGVSLLGPAQFS